ncbi:hypothetical protein P886_3093 [Alteromonadaceae bacterium 2753L.S.0a.02]|nr:hypothetical protein P886_3093 [Alteromonadaceae bacterium 2753L.S.0a.02]
MGIRLGSQNCLEQFWTPAGAPEGWRPRMAAINSGHSDQHKKTARVAVFLCWPVELRCEWEYASVHKIAWSNFGRPQGDIMEAAITKSSGTILDARRGARRVVAKDGHHQFPPLAGTDDCSTLTSKLRFTALCLSHAGRGNGHLLPQRLISLESIF